MFQRLASQVKRVSTIATKITFHVHVHRVVFSPSRDVPLGTKLSVAFERGEHEVVTTDQPVQDFGDGTHGIEVEEGLSISCTMYRDNAGKYQEKKGRLILRQRVKEKIGPDIFKGMGLVVLDLENLAHDLSPEYITFPFTRCSLGAARVMVSVSAGFGGEAPAVPTSPAGQRHSSLDDDDFLGRPYLAPPRTPADAGLGLRLHTAPSSAASTAGRGLGGLLTSPTKTATPAPKATPGAASSGQRGRADSSGSSSASSVYPDVEQDNESPYLSPSRLSIDATPPGTGDGGEMWLGMMSGDTKSAPPATRTAVSTDSSLANSSIHRMMLEYSGASSAAMGNSSDWGARFRALNQEYEKERESRQSFEEKWARERAAFIKSQARIKEMQAEMDDLYSQLNKTKAKLAASEGTSISIAQSMAARRPSGGDFGGETQTVLNRDLLAKDKECAALRRQLDDLTTVLDEQRDYYELQIQQLASGQAAGHVSGATGGSDGSSSQQVAMLQKQLEALMLHSTVADETIASMDMDNTQLRAQITELQKQMQSQEAIAREAAISKQQLEALMAHSEAADATISAMDMENAQLHAQVADLNKKLKAAAAGQPIKSDDGDVIVLKQQVEALLAHSTAADETIAAMALENDQLRAQVATLSKGQGQSGGGDAAALAQLQQQVEALMAYSSSMDETIAALNMENTELRSKQSSGAASSSSTSSAEVASLKQQVEALLQHSSTSDQTIAAMDMENSHLRSQVTDLTKQLQNAKSSSNVTSSYKEIESLRKQVEALLAHSETADTTIAAMDMEIAQLRDENSDLKKSRGGSAQSDNSGEVQALQQQIEALTNHINGLDQSIAAMEMEKSQLRSQLADSAKQIQAQRAALGTLDQNEKELVRLRGVITELTNQLEAVTVHCQTIDKNSSMLEADNARLRNDIATLKSENHNLKAVSAVENTPSFGPSKLQQLEQLTQKVASNDKIVADLKQRLKQYADKCDDLEQEKSSLTDRCAILQSQIKAMESELDESHARIRSLQDKVSQAGPKTPGHSSTDSNPFDMFEVKASTDSFSVPLSPIPNVAVSNPFEFFGDAPSTPAPPIPASPSPMASPMRLNTSVSHNADDMRQEVEMLRSNLARAQDANKILQQQFDKLNKRTAEQVKELSEANAALVQQVETHVREASEISDKIRQSYIAELEMGRAKVIAAESAVVDLEKRLENASRRNAELTNELNELTVTIAAATNDTSFEITELRNSLFEVEVGNKHLETESKSLEMQNSDLQTEVASLRTQVSILMNKGECEEHDIVALHQQIDALNAELSSQRNMSLFEISKASEENAAIKKQLTELKEALDAKTRELEATRVRYESELEASSEICEDLKDKLSASAAREQVLSTALENARASAASSTSSASSEVERLRAAVVEAEAKHSMAQKEVSTIRAELDSAMKRRDELEVSLREVTAERDALKDKCDKLEWDLQQQQDFSAHVPTSGADHSGFDKMVPAVDDWGHTTDDSHAAFGSAASSHVDSTAAEIEMLRATLQDTNTELKRLQDKYSEASALNEKLRSEASNSKSATNDDMRTADNKDVVEELIKYKMENVTIASELDEQRMRASNLERSNKRFAERIAELEAMVGGKPTAAAASSSQQKSAAPPSKPSMFGSNKPPPAPPKPPKGPAPKR